jgi:hypothetical protein
MARFNIERKRTGTSTVSNVPLSVFNMTLTQKIRLKGNAGGHEAKSEEIKATLHGLNGCSRP